MTSRHLLTLAVCIISTSVGVAENLNWSSRKIQLSVQRDHSDAPVPNGISVRKGTEQIAVVGDDHLVRIIDRRTGKLIRLLDNHTDWIKIAIYHPDGKTLYTAGSDHSIMAWNAENTHDFSRFATEDRAIEGMTIDAQGEFLATVGFNSRLNLYNLGERKLIRSIACPCQDMRAIKFSPNGELLAIAGRNGIIRVIQVRDGKNICDIPAHRKRIRDIEFVNNQTLVTCSDDMTVRKTDIASKNSTLVLKRNAKFYSLALLGSGRVAIGGSDNLIRVIDLNRNEETGTLKGHAGTVCELVVDGNELISGSFDTEIRVWQMQNSFVSAPPSRVSRPLSRPMSQPARESQPTRVSQRTNPTRSGFSTGRVNHKPASVLPASKPSSNFQLPSSKLPSSKANTAKPSSASAFQKGPLVEPKSELKPNSTFSPKPTFVPGNNSSSGFQPKSNVRNFSNSQFQIGK